MATLTVGIEAAALAEYGEWKYFRFPKTEDLMLGCTANDEQTLWVMYGGPEQRIVVACDDAYTLDMLGSIIHSEGMRLADLDPEDAAAEIVSIFGILKRLRRLDDPVEIVGWDVANGGIKHEVW
jgi:hypothetical protein